MNRSASEAPERIWLNICEEADCDDAFKAHDAENVCWSDGHAALTNAVEYVRADRATPPDGPCVWVAWDKTRSNALWLFSHEPTQDEDEDGIMHYWREGKAERLDPLFGELLGLAPGACQRFRLVPEGEGETK